MSTNQQSERIAVCPGSFDPLTNGHVDLIARAVRLFDRVVVAILVNEQKTPLLTTADRVALAREVFAAEPRVQVETFEGLLRGLCRTRRRHGRRSGPPQRRPTSTTSGR